MSDNATNIYAAPQSFSSIDEHVNSSGMGKHYPVPEGVAGWSWGAFFLNWIWSIGNRTWIGLLSLVPYVGFIMAIVLGVKGREWAWQNKRWDSIDHFNRVQRRWSIWGICLLTIPAIGIIAAIAIPAYQDRIVKTQLTHSLAYANQTAIAVGAYIEKHHALPEQLQDAGISAAIPPEIQGISLNARNGQLKVTMKENYIRGKSFFLAPSVSRSGEVTWRCLYGEIPRRLMPEQCRYDAADAFTLQ